MKIKPCPFCGKQPDVTEIKNLKLPMLSPKYKISCQGWPCKVHPSIESYDGIERAAKWWNMRSGKAR